MDAELNEIARQLDRFNRNFERYLDTTLGEKVTPKDIDYYIHSTKVVNSLRTEGINTSEDLINYCKNEYGNFSEWKMNHLLGLPNFGKKALEVVREALAKIEDEKEKDNAS